VWSDGRGGPAGPPAPAVPTFGGGPAYLTSGAAAVHASTLEMVAAEATLAYFSAEGLCGGRAEAAAARLERIGRDIGWRVAERAMSRPERPRWHDTLDAIKWVCKEFWAGFFNKQVDNLKTNHMGTYVLSDASFMWLRRQSRADGRGDLLARHLHLPAGLIGGALDALGMPCTVTSDLGAQGSPSAVFTVRMLPPKASEGSGVAGSAGTDGVEGGGGRNDEGDKGNGGGGAGVTVGAPPPAQQGEAATASAAAAAAAAAAAPGGAAPASWVDDGEAGAELVPGLPVTPAAPPPPPGVPSTPPPQLL